MINITDEFKAQTVEGVVADSDAIRYVSGQTAGNNSVAGVLNTVTASGIFLKEKVGEVAVP